MDLVPDLPPGPFGVIQLDRHLGVAPFGMATAATGRADEKLAWAAKDIDQIAVAPADDVAFLRDVGRTRQTGDRVGGRLVVLMFVEDASGVLGSAGV